MKYSIVIPTYNHCDDLLKPCIESVIRNSDMSQIELIIVANGCTDNTKEYVENINHNVKLIWINDPIGYTKAINIGIQQATGEYVLLLNNDAQVLDYWHKNQWLDVLTQPFLTDDKMAITGTNRYREHEINKDFLIFFCVLIKQTVFKQIGLLDEIFSPGYGEDIDFCIRVENSGLKWQCVDITTIQDGRHIGYFPLYHEGTATFRDQLEYYSQIVARNKLILIDRYGK
jgi:O-antigen biosynthesis protein